jgi:hypothetical protein
MISTMSLSFAHACAPIVVSTARDLLLMARSRAELRSFLKVGAFFGKNRTLDGTHLQANRAVNAGLKVDPKPVCAFAVFAGAGMDAGDRTGGDAIGNTFTNFGDNGVGHGCYISLTKSRPILRGDGVTGGPSCVS